MSFVSFFGVENRVCGAAQATFGENQHGPLGLTPVPAELLLAPFNVSWTKYTDITRGIPASYRL